MKRTCILLLSLALLLGGCGFMQGSYASVEPYLQSPDREEPGITPVSSYQEVRAALIHMVENAQESRTLSLADFNSNQVETNIQLAIRSVMTSNPIAAYAVEDIAYDLGSTGGVPAVVVTVRYNQKGSQIRSLRQVTGMNAVKELLTGTLNRVDSDLVVLVENYRQLDFTQFVEDYARENPEVIMEIPQILQSTYPETGTTRILELQLTYQTSRESLKNMQSYVRPKFNSAAMFVLGEEDPGVKYTRLYAFLMETAEYTVETSITPAYSLLRHGVGDSKAFATVFAAMCQRADLECHIVTGTRYGEPWFWNIIQEGDRYYHLDLLRCYNSGGFRKNFDEEMSGYVWDFAAYPACVPPEPPSTEPTEPVSDQTQPEETEPAIPQEETNPPETTPETTGPTEATQNS